MRHIAADGDGYLIDDAFRCRYLIGAGGTRCPVYRELFRELNPRASELQLVTLEQEIEYDWQEKDCHLWFFGHGLPGYSWYVPKERGWLNVGVGAHRGAHEEQRPRHPRPLGLPHRYAPARVRARGAVRPYRLQLLPARQCRGGAARATPSSPGMLPGLRPGISGEGIGPAIRSGLRAARSILEGTPYRLDDVTGVSITSIARSMFDRAARAGALAGRRGTHPANS